MSTKVQFYKQFQFQFEKSILNFKQLFRSSYLKMRFIIFKSSFNGKFAVYKSLGMSKYVTTAEALKTVKSGDRVYVREMLQLDHMCSM